MRRGIISVVSTAMTDAVHKAQTAADSAKQMILNRDTKLGTDMAAMRKDMADAMTKLRDDMAPTTAVHIEYRANVTVPPILSLLGTAAVDVAITWDKPFADDNYLITPHIAAGSALIGKTGAEVKSKTTTGCIITVTTTAVLAAGTARLNVVAYRKG